MERIIDVSILNTSGVQVIQRATDEANLSRTNLIDTGHIALATLADETVLRRYGVPRLSLEAARRILYDMAGYEQAELIEHNGLYLFSPAVPELLTHAQKLTRNRNDRVGVGTFFRALCDETAPCLGNAFFQRMGISFSRQP